MDNIPILEVVTERDMDLLVLEELHVSQSFSRWFAQELIGEHARGLRFRSAWHSISDASLGESDLLALYASTDETLSAILVENKIDAPPQPHQARRYVERGQVGVQRGEWHRFTTAIIAPARYLARGGDAAEFAAQLSYEKISDWLRRNVQDAERCAYKTKLVQMAIEQSRRGPLCAKMSETVPTRDITDEGETG